MDWVYHLTVKLHTFYRATDIPSVLCEPDGTELNRIGPANSFCLLLPKICPQCRCPESHAAFCELAGTAEHGYVSKCPAGYTLFSVPVFREGEIAAIILAGPVLAGSPSMEEFGKSLEKTGMDSEASERLFPVYSATVMIGPEKPRHLSRLLADLVSAGYEQQENGSFILDRKRQQQIGDYMELLLDDDEIPEQLEQEQTLIRYVVSGEQQKARSFLNDILGKIYFSSGNQFEIIKTRSIEFVVLLSRTMINKGGDPSIAYRLSEEGIRDIMKAADLLNLSMSMVEILDSFMLFAFMKYPRQYSDEIKKAVAYMENHYSDVTLKEVAEYVSMNRSYFSTLFKKKMGVSFSEYLTEQRLARAKQLLTSTRKPLSEIAFESGFSSPGYFSRTFRARTGMTPRQYRLSFRGRYDSILEINGRPSVPFAKSEKINPDS